MDDKKRFIMLLVPLLRQLRIQSILYGFQLAFALGGAVTLIILMLARIVVLPYYHQFIAAGLTVSILAAAGWVWKQWPDKKAAAAIYNRYVPEDRVASALSFYEQEGILQMLQLAEAIGLMKQEQAKVLGRKKTYAIRKWLMSGLLFTVLASLLIAFPSEKIEMAVKKEKEAAILKKLEKAVEKKAETEKNPIAKKALEELKKELAEKKTPEDALKKIAQHKKELALKELKEKEKQRQLEEYKEKLKEAGLNNLAKAIDEKDIKKAMKEVKNLSKNRSKLTDTQKQALTSLTGDTENLSENDFKTLAKKLEESLKSEENLKGITTAQSMLTKQGESLQKEMASNGLPPSQVALNPSSGQPGSKSPSGEGTPPGSSGGQPQNSGKSGSNPGSGNGQTPGSGSGSGQGSGSGTGAGTGSGQGSGSGNGTGSGSGQGGSGTGSSPGGSQGSGAGLGQGSRDFLTVPEKTGGKNNLETDTGTIGKGSPQQQFESDGPVLKGNLRPYEEVFGEYANAYRNSSERMKLPGELETIVRNYFSDLDPDKE